MHQSRLARGAAPRGPDLGTLTLVNGSVTLRSKPQPPPLARIAPDVWLCGPVAPRIGPSRGGYETANRRLAGLLEGQGVAVRELAYPDTLGAGPLRKLWRYRAGFGRIRAALTGAAHWRGDGAETPPILHMTPLLRQFALQEWRAIRAARTAGLRVVLDLRAGNKLRDLARWGPGYRGVIGSTLSMADALCHEGAEQAADWAALAPGKPTIWLPNFVAGAEVAGASPRRDAGVIRLIHLGTVSAAKGVPDAIGVADALVAAGLRVRLDIVGRAAPEYAPTLRAACARRPHLRFHGPLSAAAVRPLLDRATVFLFLTKWRGEGQSNALTEAMARGCVPVVTRHGFNASTVGDCGLLVEDRDDHAAIARRIAALSRTGASGGRYRLAQAAIATVEARFTQTAVLPVLARAYGAAQGDGDVG